MEYNLVEIWLRRDPARWIAGALGGLVAGAVAMALAMVMAQASGYEALFPVKLMGTIILGSFATESGPNMSSILAGCAVFEFICLFWGVVYAHFTGTNALKALLPIGLVWGLFSWIFTWNLFLQSFKTIFSAQISSAAVFPICVVYGLALASVAFFDPIFRGGKRI